MSISLNLILLLLFGIWFYKKINNPRNRLIFPIVLLFIGAVVALFTILTLIDNEYLDFVANFVVASFSLILFWIYSTIVIIITNIQKGSRTKIFTDLLQTSALLIMPIAFYWWIISDVPLNIGG